MTTAGTPIIATAEIEPVRWHVEQARILLRAEHTGQVFSIVEVTTPPGGGPGPHVHERESETFYVLEGEYEIVVAGESVRAEPGVLVHSPSGVAHGFRNVGASPARMLCTFAPGGAEKMFEELAMLLGEPGRVDPQAIAEITAAHGMRPAERTR